MVAFVTGASGFVGSAVVRKLLERGETVRVLMREGCDRSNLLGLEVEYATGDLRDRASLKSAMAGAASVYHVAADYRLWALNEAEIYESNVGGTENIMRAGVEAGVDRMVYTSSVCTLGTKSDGAPSDESAPVSADEMIGAYKKSKFMAEECVNGWIGRGAPVVIVNPSTPIGPGDVKPTPTGRMISEAVHGKMPAYVNTGLNFVHVDDVALGHLLAHDKGTIGERYILGGYNLSLKALLEMIAALTGRRPPKIELPRRAIYPIAIIAEAVAKITGREPLVTINGLRLAKKLMYFSSAKAEADLGYTFRPIAETLAEAVAWFGADAIEQRRVDSRAYATAPSLARSTAS